MPIPRAGRARPGSNWHFYPPDPDGHTNELYYGIEQIGWDGYSKPRDMYGVRYSKPPQLPHKSEYAEVKQATSDGIPRSEEHTSELQSQSNLVCRLLLEKKKK